MTNYIPADKLIAEIKGIIAAVQTTNHPDALGTMGQCMAAAEIEAINLILDAIKELQQEQPDSPSLTERSIVWFENIAANAKRLSAGNVSHLGPTIVGMAIRSKEFLEKHKQEQPEVDLEKEIGTYFQGWTDCDDYSQALNAEGECVSTDEIIEIARHFYKLGLNSRTEDVK